MQQSQHRENLKKLDSKNQLCPICDRILGNKLIEKHHLIPKTFKGKEMVLIHKICHSKIHSVFSEREILNWYHTIERIKSHLEIEKFIKWVQKYPSDFYSKNKETNVRYGKRK